MEELRKQLVELINNSQLPFEATYYVVKDVFREVADVYKSMLESAKTAGQESETEVKDAEPTAAAPQE